MSGGFLNKPKTEEAPKKTQGDLPQSKDYLTKASAELQATKVALDQKTQEADGLKTQMADKDKDLQSTKTDLASAQDTLKKITDTLKGLGFEDVGSIEKLRDKITSMGDENKVLGQELLSLRTDNQQLKE